VSLVLETVLECWSSTSTICLALDALNCIKVNLYEPTIRTLNTRQQHSTASVVAHHCHPGDGVLRRSDAVPGIRQVAELPFQRAYRFGSRLFRWRDDFAAAHCVSFIRQNTQSTEQTMKNQTHHHITAARIGYACAGSDKRTRSLKPHIRVPVNWHELVCWHVRDLRHDLEAMGWGNRSGIQAL